MNTRRVRRSRWLIRYTLHRLRFTISINYQIINSTIRITLEYWYSFASPPLFLNFYSLFIYLFFFTLFHICARVTMCNITLYFIFNSRICSRVITRSRSVRSFSPHSERSFSLAHIQSRTYAHFNEIVQSVSPPRRSRHSLLLLFFFLSLLVVSTLLRPLGITFRRSIVESWVGPLLIFIINMYNTYV